MSKPPEYGKGFTLDDLMKQREAKWALRGQVGLPTPANPPTPDSNPVQRMIEQVQGAIGAMQGLGISADTFERASERALGAFKTGPLWEAMVEQDPLGFQPSRSRGFGFTDAPLESRPPQFPRYGGGGGGGSQSDRYIAAVTAGAGGSPGGGGGGGGGGRVGYGATGRVNGKISGIPIFTDNSVPQGQGYLTDQSRWTISIGPGSITIGPSGEPEQPEPPAPRGRFQNLDWEDS